VYPSALRRNGQEGLVRLRFVINEFGVAEEASLRILSLSHPAFGPPALETIRRSVFEPATAGGCPAKQMVEQNIRFRLNR
jgi:TonB family protein